MGNRHSSAVPIGVPATTFGAASAAAGPTQNTPRQTELEGRKAEFRRDALKACHQLTQKNNSPIQTNLFFIPQYGHHVEDVAAKICEVAGFNLNYVAADYQDDFKTAARLYRRHGAQMWTDAAAAISALKSSGEQHLALSASRAPKFVGRNRAMSRVFAYTQSPVEDLYIRLPMMLDGKCDADTIAEERMCLNNRFRQICDRMSIYNCLWIYLRVSDTCWSELLEAHRRQRTCDTELVRMCEYRARMDSFFKNNDFVDGYHTLRIDVEYAQLENELVCHNIAKIVADFVMDQYYADMWSPDMEDAAFINYIRSMAYKEQRIKNAVATQWLEGAGVPGKIRTVQTVDMIAAVSAARLRSLSTSSSRVNIAMSPSRAPSNGSSDSPRASLSLSGSQTGRLRPVNPGAPATTTSNLIASAPVGNLYDAPLQPTQTIMQQKGSRLAEFRRASQPNFIANK